MQVPKRQRDEEYSGQADHERTGVAMRQLHHGVVEEKEKIVGKPQQDAGEGVGDGQVDEQDVVDGRLLARYAEPPDHADDEYVQGHRQQRRLPLKWFRPSETFGLVASSDVNPCPCP